MKHYFLFVLSAILMMASCSDDKETPIGPTPDPDPDPPVENIVITLNETELYLPKGSQFQLSAELSEDDGDISWESENRAVAIVDRTGKVVALSLGTTTITARSEHAEASCVVTVVEHPEVGWFYYDDGTYSAQLNLNKNPIGVVFWVGDPTEHDEALRRDHPNCTNGLVVALNDDGKNYHWQPNYEQYRRTVGEWIEANCPEYVTITSPWGQDEAVNAMRGYNNTKAIEAFNAAPENAQWGVEVVERVVEYRSEYPAPSSSSDWYLPSVKECSLLLSGPTNGNVLDVNDNITNLTTINYKLELIPGGSRIGRNGFDDDIWSSNERDYEYAFYLSCLSGKVWMNWKLYESDHHFVRCILAF